MDTAGTFTSVIQALHAANYLRAHGVRAHVADNADAYRIALIPVLVDSENLTLANELLDQYSAEPPPDTDDLDQAAEPDLSRLDPGFAPACPDCAAKLPIDDIDRCPRCNAPVDIPALIADQFGPEVLAPCYETPRISATILGQAALFCPSCRYNLDGLPPVGDCPECGVRYSKESLLGGGP